MCGADLPDLPSEDPQEDKEKKKPRPKDGCYRINTDN
jgi:hypothetical protein